VPSKSSSSSIAPNVAAAGVDFAAHLREAGLGDRVAIPADGAWAELDDEPRERASHRSARGVSSEAGC